MSVEIHPFEYRPNNCPKCGYILGHEDPRFAVITNPPRARFCIDGGIFKIAESRMTLYCGEIKTEHLHVACPRCGYEWLTETADAKKEPA